MEVCEKLKVEYLSSIEKLICDWKEKANELKSEDANDEAIIEAIKVNIGDIFYKMFNLSYNQSCKNSKPVEEQLKNLYENYIAFFEKIPSSWKINMENAKKYNKSEEYYKEEVKLRTAEMIKELFINYYKELNR